MVGGSQLFAVLGFDFGAEVLGLGARRLLAIARPAQSAECMALPNDLLARGACAQCGRALA